MSFTFKADGSTLTGSTTGLDGKTIQIKNGKVDGDKISFSVDLDFGGMPLTLAYTGVVSSDQIKLTIDIMGMRSSSSSSARAEPTSGRRLAPAGSMRTLANQVGGGVELEQRRTN